MKWKEVMDIRVGCVIFFCILMVIGDLVLIGELEWGAESEDYEFFFDNDDSLEIDKEMWEQILNSCRLDFMQTTGSFEAFSSHLNEEMSAGATLQNVLSVLPPDSKQSLLSCLQKESIPFRVSDEEVGTKNWYIGYLESLFSSFSVSRRHLDEKVLQGTAPPRRPVLRKRRRRKRKKPRHGHAFSPAPAPAVQSPTYAPEPSYGPAPVSFYEPKQDPPAEARRPQLAPPNIKKPKASSPAIPKAPSPAKPKVPSPAKPKARAPSPAKLGVSSQPPSDNHVPVAVSVGATAAGTFVFVMFVLLCYRKRNKIHSGNTERDDRPLLSLSLKDFSIGSSRKPSLGGTVNNEKFGSLSFGTNINQNGKLSSSNHNFSTASNLSSTEASALSETAGAVTCSQESSSVSSVTSAPVVPSSQQKAPAGNVGPLPPGPPPPPIPAKNPPAPPPIPANNPPAPPPIPANSKPGPPPPPPPKGVAPPRAPPAFPVISKPPPLRPKQLGKNAHDETPGENLDSGAPKSKLKPFFWDKVLANPDQSMVWHEISSGSFQFDEEMIENLFGCTTANNNKMGNKKGSQGPSHQYIQILDNKKAQNISILLRALNVKTEEVSDALHNGSELPSELLQTLLRMAPTSEEELKLRLYNNDVALLGPAERFIKVLVDIPFAFKRLDSLLFKNSLQEEISGIKESLATLEVASTELKNSRLFLKLLEAVLKTGNRMNSGTFRGGAQAFKLDTLLKLADVKGTDGKTTLLHFVVQEIIRSEGKRGARAGLKPQEFSGEDPETINYLRTLGLEVVSRLSTELENVRKAAALDSDAITSTVSKLGHGLVRTKNFIKSNEEEDKESGFYRVFSGFVEEAEVEITKLLEEEKRIMGLVKTTVDYFHGSAAGKDEGLRLFVIVRDFLIMLDKACAEVKKSTTLVKKKPVRDERIDRKSLSMDLTQRQIDDRKTLSMDLTKRHLFPAIVDRRIEDDTSSSSSDSSDEES